MTLTLCCYRDCEITLEVLKKSKISKPISLWTTNDTILLGVHPRESNKRPNFRRCFAHYLSYGHLKSILVKLHHLCRDRAENKRICDLMGSCQKVAPRNNSVSVVRLSTQHFWRSYHDPQLTQIPQDNLRLKTKLQLNSQKNYKVCGGITTL